MGRWCSVIACEIVYEMISARASITCCFCLPVLDYNRLNIKLDILQKERIMNHFCRIWFLLSISPELRNIPNIFAITNEGSAFNDEVFGYILLYWILKRVLPDEDIMTWIFILHYRYSVCINPPKDYPHKALNVDQRLFRYCQSEQLLNKQSCCLLFPAIWSSCTVNIMALPYPTHTTTLPPPTHIHV